MGFFEFVGLDLSLPFERRLARLFAAVAAGDVEQLRRMRRQFDRASLHYRTRTGATPLSVGIAYQQWKVLECLVTECDVNVDERGPFDDTALMRAAELG